MYTHKKTIYIDNAATSYPKPPEVLSAMTHAMRHQGGNPGRSSHAMARASAEGVYACRALAAKLFDASPQRVIFTSGTTQALNMAIKGLLSQSKHPIPHVLCSDMEHNAVYRPLCKLKATGRITFDTFDTLPTSPHVTTEAILSAITRKLRPETAMVVCAHASNICSATLPIQAIGKLCHDKGIALVVDGAQSGGHLPLRVRDTASISNFTASSSALATASKLAFPPA